MMAGKGKKGGFAKGDGKGYGATGSPPEQQAMECLAGLTTVEVREKANYYEQLSYAMDVDIEMGNKYRVVAGPNHPEGPNHQIFFGIERTDCCMKQMKTSCRDCAPWDLDILYTEGNNRPTTAFRLRREWTFTCCCFNRPKVDVLSSSGQVIGSIVDPYSCCGNLTFQILGPQGQEVLTADGGCCQCGLCCPMSCGPCAQVQFPIKRDGLDVGNVEKQLNCCGWGSFDELENYKIDFGGVTNPQNKALLMALAIFIDFRYFSSAF